MSPTELETFLRTHPYIEDAAVIGVNLPNGLGEGPRAYIIVDETSHASPTDDDIREYVSTNLASYKALTGGIKRVQSIPKSVSGKILRKILVEMAKEETAKEKMVERLGIQCPVVDADAQIRYESIQPHSPRALTYCLPLFTSVVVFASCWFLNHALS